MDKKETSAEELMTVPNTHPVDGREMDSSSIGIDPLKIIRQWHRGLCISHKAHAVAATTFHRRNLLLGIPVVILTTIVGTAVFGSMATSPSTWAKIIVGLLSLVAASLASLQTFLRYSETSEKHKAAAVKYGSLRREVEELLVTGKKEEVLSPSFLKSLRTRWDDVDQVSPAVPQRLLDPIVADFKARDLW